MGGHGLNCLSLAVEMVELSMPLPVVLSQLLVSLIGCLGERFSIRSSLYWHCRACGGLLEALHDRWLWFMGWRFGIIWATDGWPVSEVLITIRTSLLIDLYGLVRIGLHDVDGLVRIGCWLVLVGINGLGLVRMDFRWINCLLLWSAWWSPLFNSAVILWSLVKGYVVLWWSCNEGIGVHC